MKPALRKILWSFLVFLCLGIVLLIALNSYVISQSVRSFLSQHVLTLESELEKPVEIVPALVPSPLNGLPIAKERAELPILAVMVENSPPARPQSGLQKADIVYETLAEGGITRFMALFQSQEADILGPVRSARTYFAEIVSEYDAWYAHVGGSFDGLNFIAKNHLHNLDQFIYDKPYWRDSTRRKARGLEHSMYTDTNDLRTVIGGFLVDKNGVKKIGADKGEVGKNSEAFSQSVSFDSWLFQKKSDSNDLKDARGLEDYQGQPKSQAVTQDVSAIPPERDPAAAVGEASSITLDFSFPVFKVQWIYDPVGNIYKRKMANIEHKDDKDGQQLTAKNILVQYASIFPLAAGPGVGEGALGIKLVGNGDGLLFRDGKTFPLKWSKEKSGERTKFYDEEGNLIAFNPGVIWVEIIEKGKVTFDDNI